MILGSGDFKFEVVDSWPNMPRYWSFGSSSDVSINSDDEIHVFSRGSHPLTVWNKHGDFITSWGEGKFSDLEVMQAIDFVGFNFFRNDWEEFKKIESTRELSLNEFNKPGSKKFIN